MLLLEPIWVARLKNDFNGRDTSFFRPMEKDLTALEEYKAALATAETNCAIAKQEAARLAEMGNKLVAESTSVLTSIQCKIFATETAILATQLADKFKDTNFVAVDNRLGVGTYTTTKTDGTPVKFRINYYAYPVMMEHVEMRLRTNMYVDWKITGLQEPQIRFAHCVKVKTSRRSINITAVEKYKQMEGDIYKALQRIDITSVFPCELSGTYTQQIDINGVCAFLDFNKDDEGQHGWIITRIAEQLAVGRKRK